MVQSSHKPTESEHSITDQDDEDNQESEQSFNPECSRSHTPAHANSRSHTPTHADTRSHTVKKDVDSRSHTLTLIPIEDGQNPEQVKST